MGGICILVALSFLAAPADEDPELPEIPNLTFESFAAEIRDQVDQAYAELRAKPRDPGANGHLGMLLQAYDQMENASICYRRARSLAPAEFRWAYYLAVTHAALGRHGEAAAVMREALGIKGDYLPAQLQLAESLLLSGRVEESSRICEGILAKDAECAEAHYGLGRAKAAAGDQAAAAGHYRRACEIFPEFGAAHYALALTYRRLRETSKAGQHFALYEKFRMGRPPLQDPLSEELSQVLKGAHHIVKKAVLLESAGQFEASIAEHERAVQVDPGNLQAHLNLSTLYGKLGKAEESEKHYRAAVAINPNLAPAHYNFGKLLADQGREKEAAEAFRRALEVNPNHAEAHQNYASLLMLELRLDEAEHHYREAIRNRPNYRMAHFNLGRILVHRGRISDAIEHLLQTLEPEDESTPLYLYGLAAAYARAGDREKALRFMRDARQKAAALGQTELVGAIDKDLHAIEKSGPKD
jgi:tetratricopeptide (TPR) repeat protein